MGQRRSACAPQAKQTLLPLDPCPQVQARPVQIQRRLKPGPCQFSMRAEEAQVRPVHDCQGLSGEPAYPFTAFSSIYCQGKRRVNYTSQAVVD